MNCPAISVVETPKCPFPDFKASSGQEVGGFEIDEKCHNNWMPAQSLFTWRDGSYLVKAKNQFEQRYKVKRTYGADLVSYMTNRELCIFGKSRKS